MRPRIAFPAVFRRHFVVISIAIGNYPPREIPHEQKAPQLSRCDDLFARVAHLNIGTGFAKY